MYVGFERCEGVGNGLNTKTDCVKVSCKCLQVPGNRWLRLSYGLTIKFGCVSMDRSGLSEFWNSVTGLALGNEALGFTL